MFSQHFKIYCLVSRFSFLSLFGGLGPVKLPTLMLNSQNSARIFQMPQLQVWATTPSLTCQVLQNVRNIVNKHFCFPSYRQHHRACLTEFKHLNVSVPLYWALCEFPARVFIPGHYATTDAVRTNEQSLVFCIVCWWLVLCFVIQFSHRAKLGGMWL